MIILDNFLLTFTLLLSPFKLSGFNNIALNCFFNSGTQIMFSNPFIHHLHFHLYKSVHFSKPGVIKGSLYNAANAFINLLPDYYTGNTVGHAHNIKADKNLEFYLRELYIDRGLEYGDEGDSADPLSEYFRLFDALVPDSVTNTFRNYSINSNTLFTQTARKEYIKVSSDLFNIVYLDEKYVESIKNGEKFSFEMFTERLKHYAHFGKNMFVRFGPEMIRQMTEEFLRMMLKFEIETLNFNGVPVKVGLSLQAFDKSAADLRTGQAFHYWAYVYKNEKWYVGNDSSLSEVIDIKSEISSYRHHVFRFNIDYIINNK